MKGQDRTAEPAYHRPSTQTVVMLVGEVYLETMATGIITQEEIDWLTIGQSDFSREEEAMALKIGRLLDEGSIQIGCRLLGEEAPAHRAAGGVS
jgi:hypothetical protein